MESIHIKAYNACTHIFVLQLNFHARTHKLLQIHRVGAGEALLTVLGSREAVDEACCTMNRIFEKLLLQS